MTTNTQGKITMEDVRQALAGDDDNPVDPFATNARKIRDIIGRGSMATIQKHLQTIRDEKLGEDKEPEDTDIPAPPEEAVAAIWKSAWTAAHTAILERCASLNDDRDRLRQSLQVSTDDGQALVDEVARLEAESEEKSGQIAAQAAQATEVAEAHAHEVATLTARLDEAHAQNQRMEALIEKALFKAKENSNE